MVDLQDAAAFSDQYGTLLSILMLDLDYFKKINDTHGHTVGDEVLRTLSAKLRQLVSSPELIGRYGGEEFLVIIPHATAQSAREYANRICEQVRALSISTGDQVLTLTVSIGIAQYRTQQEDWQTLLNRADQALIKAKHKGRDQVMIADK
jgi:diguanylate cyclase (GGDEF)-like protein